jgi:P4 family phage/plasmid primase-like protien
MNGTAILETKVVTPPASAAVAKSPQPTTATTAKPGPYKPQSGSAPDTATQDKMDPNRWFKERFPKLADKHGEPVSIRTTNGKGSVQGLNESFLAECLGADASPDAPTVYLRGENRFYTYRPEKGIYTIASEEDVAARLSGLLLSCARECREGCDVTALEFTLRDSSSLAGKVKRAKSVLCVPDDFFGSGMENFLPVGNGIIRVADRTLIPFSPQYHFRNKLAADYVAGARCPMFEETLLGASLEFDDVGLLQRWSGLAVVGRNISQAIMILSGTAGAGKGTFIRVLAGVIGEANIGSLRTDKLGERFEIGLQVGRTVLYGADVPANFLSKESASKLKSLTGGDTMPVEMKGSMNTVPLKGEFNVIVTSNSRLIVRLEGDVDAWQRRLVIVSYDKAKPKNTIPDLDKRILETEASGVLNWMLDGLYALRTANWQLALSPVQKTRVDGLLLESDSVKVFFSDCCIADTTAAGMTVADAFAAYCNFCLDRGWNGVERRSFGGECPEMVQRLFRLAMRHDIKGQDGKTQRGWKGLRLIQPGEVLPE